MITGQRDLHTYKPQQGFAQIMMPINFEGSTSLKAESLFLSVKDHLPLYSQAKAVET
jgi:hypothetical protein